MPYSATVLSLVPLARKRAALNDWSPGGWSDVYGAEIAGMGCGWGGGYDNDYGCPKGFGGFDGIEFPSATGPFPGQAIYMV
eukprot:SAG31_NODE_3463_length_4245_cov_2.612397_3_plen_81_part_00